MTYANRIFWLRKDQLASKLELMALFYPMCHLKKRKFYLYVKYGVDLISLRLLRTKAMIAKEAEGFVYRISLVTDEKFITTDLSSIVK